VGEGSSRWEKNNVKFFYACNNDLELEGKIHEMCALNTPLRRENPEEKIHEFSVPINPCCSG
jgi:hypothetical protein